MKKFLNCLFVVVVIVMVGLAISCEEEVVQGQEQGEENSGFLAPSDGIWDLVVINTKWNNLENAIAPFSSTILDLEIVQSGENLRANFVTEEGNMLFGFPLTIEGSSGVITFDPSTKFNLHFSSNPDGSQCVCTIEFTKGKPIYFEYVEK